jgi:hypothetical protein
MEDEPASSTRPSLPPVTRRTPPVLEMGRHHTTRGTYVVEYWLGDAARNTIEIEVESDGTYKRIKEIP